MKESDGNFFGCWGGIASLQIALSAVWSGARRRGAGPEAIAKWMCENTARVAGLADAKGRIAAGHDADIVIWQTDETFDVDPVSLFHRHRVTPYAGMTLHGRVTATYLGGNRIDIT
jgi:allantoinase